MPFLDDAIRWNAKTHLLSGIWLSSMTVPTVTVKGCVALVAPMDAGTRALAGEFGYARGIGVAAMTANRPVRPIEAFKMLAGLVGVGEDRIGQKDGHRLILD